MKTYTITFTGRKIGAIGTTYEITEHVTAESQDAAILKLYEDYDHIKVMIIIVIGEMITKLETTINNKTYQNKVNIKGFVLTTAERRLVEDRTAFYCYLTLHELVRKEKTACLYFWKENLKRLRECLPDASIDENGVNWNKDEQGRFMASSLVRLEFLEVLMCQVTTTLSESITGKLIS